MKEWGGVSVSCQLGLTPPVVIQAHTLFHHQISTEESYHYHLHHLNSNSLLHLPNMKFASLALAVSVSALPAKTSGQNVHARSLRSPTVAVVVPTSNSDTERRLGRGDSEPQGNGPCNGLCNAYDNSGCRTSNK